MSGCRAAGFVAPAVAADRVVVAVGDNHVVARAHTKAGKPAPDPLSEQAQISVGVQAAIEEEAGRSRIDREPAGQERRVHQFRALTAAR